VIREGNPGRRPVKEGIKLPPTEVEEPDWLEVFSAAGTDTEIERLRFVASREWSRIVPVLKVSAGLGIVDMTVLTDYCVCVARIDQGERSLTRDGVLIEGERGWQKSGWTTIVGQYRTQLRAYIVELGLSPSARMKIGPAKDDDGDSDPFD
jgi:P27 family predicted phage terminase small subunit